ncbi:hypothetical protein PIB30_071200 [Stylosanthes scabra]|uniref:Uncharacterized protein n=1 Tax=Stylosanthes scabra TaxID=79078 RepID=A0ABU6SQ22_9FABA|nr:hypothetical protein [Stylosanthes scabra]
MGVTLSHVYPCTGESRWIEKEYNQVTMHPTVGVCGTKPEACGARNKVWKQFCPEVPRICVDAGAYAYTQEQTTPRHPLIKPRRGPYPFLSTHRRGSPRISVDQQPLALEAPTPKPTPRRAHGSLGMALIFPTLFRDHA